MARGYTTTNDTQMTTYDISVIIPISDDHSVAFIPAPHVMLRPFVVKRYRARPWVILLSLHILSYIYLLYL